MSVRKVVIVCGTQQSLSASGPLEVEYALLKLSSHSNQQSFWLMILLPRLRGEIYAQAIFLPFLKNLWCAVNAMAFISKLLFQDF